MSNGYNAKKAYQSVYPKASDKSARDTFSLIMKHPAIQEYYEEKKKAAILEAGITQEHILQEMGMLAFTPLGEDNPVSPQVKHNSLKVLLDWVSKDIVEQDKSTRTITVSIGE